VTGVRHVGTKVGFANLGLDVSIAAPGGNCVNVGPGQPCLYSLDTTTNLGATTPGENGYTDRVDNFNVGTSFAAPIVSGIAALMYSVNGSLTPAKLAERLKASARPFPTSPDTNVPTCRLPESPTDQQLAECNCTVQTCGAGLAHAPGAVEAGSLGADGRTISGYEWSIVSGATALSAATGSQTSFVAPAAGATVVVRLTVTDDAGQRDSTDATVQVLSPAPAPPPAPPPLPTPSPGELSRGGGGGPFDALALLLASALAWRLRRLRRATSCRD